LANELKALVVLRDRVVHRFCEEHESRSLHGCTCALAFLSEADATLCRYLDAIKGWALAVDEARSHFAGAMSDEIVLDAILGAASAATGDEESSLA